MQETLLAAWRGLERFEGRASLGSWLYRIATNRSLNALRDRGRRPQELPPPPEETPPPPARRGEPVWLEPYPDVLLESVRYRSQQPEARYEAREAIGLAFVAGLQQLPPRQRAVLVLRDVLAFRAAEVADMLGVTEVSVNRALHRARQALERAVPPVRDVAPLPGSREERELVARFTAAFEAGDVPHVIALLTDDALLTMPPEPLEYQGPLAIGRFLSTVPAGGALERFRLVPTRANGQPALRLLPTRSPRTDRPRVRAHGPHPQRQPRRRDHRLPGHKRVPLLRPSANAPRVVANGVRRTPRARVRTLLANRSDVTERKMFGGLIGGNMCCGVNGKELIVRLDPDREDEALARPHARPMDLTGRRMRGFITVHPDGLKGDRLHRWVQEAVARAASLPPK